MCREFGTVLWFLDLMGFRNDFFAYLRTAIVYLPLWFGFLRITDDRLIDRLLLAQRCHDLLLDEFLNALAIRSTRHKIDVRHLEQFLDDQFSAAIPVCERCDRLLLA